MNLEKLASLVSLAEQNLRTAQDCLGLFHPATEKARQTVKNARCAHALAKMEWVRSTNEDQSYGL